MKNKRIKKGFLFLILFLSATTSYARSLDIHAIKAQYEDKNYVDVILLSKKYLATHSEDSDVWFLSGSAKYRLGDYSGALHDFKTAIALAPRDPDLWIALVQTYYAEQDYKRAMETTLLAKKYIPGNKDLILFEAKIAIAQNKLSDAEKILQQLNEENPQDPAVRLAIKNLENAQAAAAPRPSPQLHPQNILVETQSSGTIVEKSTEQQAILVKQQAQPYLFGSPVTTATSPLKKAAVTLQEIQKLIQNNQQIKADQLLKQYIHENPTDADGYFILAKSYQQQGKFKLAYAEFQKVAELTPNYPDLNLSVIHLFFDMQDYQQVIVLASEGLNKDPSNVDLICALAQAEFALHHYKEAIDLLTSQPNYQQNPQIMALYRQMNADTAYRYVSYFKTGVNLGDIIVVNPNQNWTLSSVYAQYNTPRGNIGGQINYQTRPGFDAPQYQINVQPTFSDSNYANMSYAYANDPTLFPDQMVYAEDFQTLPWWNIGVSLGDTYRKLPLTSFNAYTGTIGKYWGSYYFQFRPTYFAAQSGPNSMLYTFTFEKYFAAENYIGLVVSEGSAPDLADLNTPSIIKTGYQTYMITGQQLLSPRFQLQYSAGESIENFGSGNIRYYTMLNLGLSFRDVPL